MNDKSNKIPEYLTIFVVISMVAAAMGMVKILVKILAHLRQ